MRRFFVQPEQITGNKVMITGSEVRHLSKVLRLKDGEEVVVLNGLGDAFLVELTTVNEEVVRGLIKEQLALASEAPLEVTLVQSVLKGEKMDWVIQKATELGVSRIIPLESERTVVRLNGAKAEERRKRWGKIAQEAVKQCGRVLAPEVAPVQSWEEVLSHFQQDDLVLLPWEEEKNQGLQDALRQNRSGRVFFFVGPEGGFSPREAEMAIEAGAQPVSLGPRILRAETAALAVLSIILYQLGDLGTKPFKCP